MSQERSTPPSARTRLIERIRHDKLMLIIVVGTLVAPAILVALFVMQPPIEPPTIGTELTKALVQFAVVALGGAVIAAIVRSAELDREAAQREKERRRLDFDYFMSIFRDVTDTYNSVKSVHRKLNAANVRPPKLTTEQSALVEQQMDVLNEAQLSLETMMRVMRVREGAFRSNGASVDKRLTYCLRQMEGYINDVLVDTRKPGSRMVALGKFLGGYSADGGIRRGGRFQSSKFMDREDEPDWQPEHDVDGNGPSVHLRHIEHTIAEVIRGAS